MTLPLNLTRHFTQHPILAQHPMLHMMLLLQLHRQLSPRLHLLFLLLDLVLYVSSRWNVGTFSRVVACLRFKRSSPAFAPSAFFAVAPTTSSTPRIGPPSSTAASPRLTSSMTFGPCIALFAKKERWRRLATEETLRLHSRWAANKELRRHAIT